MPHRIIPCLLLSEGRLVKTVRFRHPKYIGDPVNTVRIFNELEVDELCFLDIDATKQSREPDYYLLQQLADECFMPLSYGGGIRTVEQARRIVRCGFDKLVINSAASPDFVSALATTFGTQCIVVSIDVDRNFLGRYVVRSTGEARGTTPVEWAKKMEEAGAGEILLTAVSQEGSWDGFDLPLVKQFSSVLDIPLIAHGGAGNTSHIREVIVTGGASAVALGSMVVYQQKNRGVLVNFPRTRIDAALID